MIAQLRETLADLRRDHDALCSLLFKEGMISAKGLAQEKHLQCVAVTCRACPTTFVFDINGIALAATRFMTRDDHAGLRTTSKQMSQCMSATSSAVIPSKIIVADLEGHTELFDTISGRWETLQSMCEPRDAPVSAVIRGRFHVCGGWSPGDGRVTNSAECFDPLQKGWRSLRPMSVHHADAAAVVVGHHMYVCGGRDVYFHPHNSVESFDTVSEVWEPAMAQGRFNAGAAVIRGRIYVVGGRVGTGTMTSNVERFDDAWTTVPPVTHFRSLCTTAVIAEKLYVCGGEGGRAHNTVERFDPAHETWELLRPTLYRRKDTTMEVLRDRLYLIGGMGDYRRPLDSVECYDPETDSWAESTPMSHARFGAMVARVHGSLYVFGGKSQGLGELTSLERLDPITGWWESLPDMTVAQASVVAAIHA